MEIRKRYAAARICFGENLFLVSPGKIRLLKKNDPEKSLAFFEKVFLLVHEKFSFSAYNANLFFPPSFLKNSVN